MNKGVIEPQLRITDYIAGQTTGIDFEPLNKEADWEQYLPTEEAQYVFFETSSCVAFSALNCIETTVNYMLTNGLISKGIVKKLEDWGYIDDNEKFNCSDWFTARMAGTTITGASVEAVWNSIRKDGLLPDRLMPTINATTPEEYFNKQISQDLKDFAKHIFEVFEFKYEWVATGNCGIPNFDFIKKHLQQAPLQLAAPLCNRDQYKVFQPCGVCTTQHATLIYKIDDFVYDFDHYSPYKNKYSLTYPLPWIMKGVVLLTNKQKQMTIIEKLIEMYKKVVSILLK